MTLPRTALVGAVVAAATILVAPATTAPSNAAGCPTWSKTRVAGGFSTLENLAFDGAGLMILSESPAAGKPGALRGLTPAGVRTTVVPDVPSPGGLVVDGRTLYFNTGDGLASGAFGKADGTLEKVDLDTGTVSTVATGLVMPNGLIRLPGGDFVASRDLGTGAMSRITTSGVVTPFAAQATSTNGMAVDPARGEFYVDSTFTTRTVISVISLAAPNATLRSYTIPGIGPLNSADDLTLGPDGLLYVALNVGGKVVRLDPVTGAQCTIATNLPFVSSVRFGSGPGWDPASLYATSFTGTVTRLTP